MYARVRAYVCVKIRNGDRDVGSMTRSAMLEPALLLTGSAVPVVAIRTVVGCARGDGFLCVGAEEL